MDERVQQKLLERGYDPQRRERATPTDVTSIFKKYIGGLVLFSGGVIARSGYNTVLSDENIYVTTTKIEDKRSLYISPLEKRIKEEYITMYNIEANDNVCLDGVRNNTFCLLIEDARKRNIATFEFWVKGEMVYVPKRANS